MTADAPNVPTVAPRVAAYAEAIYEAKQGDCEIQRWSELTAASQRFWLGVARAVVAVADAEQAELRAEVARQARTASEIEDWRLHEVARAEAAERARDAALAEVTELRDRLGRVEALAEEWANRPHPDGPESVSDWQYRMHVNSLGSIAKQRAEASRRPSPWLPPTRAERVIAERVVDSRKHDGAIWWDGTSCTLVRDEDCPEAWGMHTDRDRYVEAIARHLAWHARGEAASPTEQATEGGAK